MRQVLVAFIAWAIAGPCLAQSVTPGARPHSGAENLNTLTVNKSLSVPLITPAQLSQYPGVSGTAPIALQSVFGPMAAMNTYAGNGVANFNMILNNLPASTNALPEALVGVADVVTTGNQAFAIYGLGVLNVSGGVAIAGEFTCRNYGGAPDTSIPPNESIGTSTNVCNALQVTEGGSYDDSIGLLLGGEGGATHFFNTDIYLKPDYDQYGLFVDSQTASFTGSIASGVLTASSVSGGILHPGYVIAGSGVTGGTTITSQLSGTTNGAGTYQTSGSQTISSEAMTANANQTDAVLKNNGTGINLELFTSGAMAAANTVLEVVDASSTIHMYVKQNGDTGVNALLAAANSNLTLSQNATTSFSVINTNAGASAVADLIATSQSGSLTVGADDGFIAGEFQSRFLALGLRGAAIGFPIGAMPAGGSEVPTFLSYWT